MSSITGDGLINAFYGMKSQYQARGEWIFHRDAVRQVRELKDGQGRYLFEPADSPGDPDMLLGRPIDQSEYAPNTFTTGLYVGAFGDLSFYTIVDSLAFSIQRLSEKFADTDQTGFIARMETDGAPTYADAFTRIKLA